MGLGLGLGLGIWSGAPAPVGGSTNANLLLYSEQMNQSIWTVSGAGVVVTPNDGLDPLGELTADRLEFGGAGATIGQTTGIAAATGAAATATVTMGASWSVRHSLFGTFDGAVYYLSLWLNDTFGSDIQIRLELAGGFLRASIRDLGDSPSPLAWGWKLETPTLTDYVKREGV